MERNPSVGDKYKFETSTEKTTKQFTSIADSIVKDATTKIRYKADGEFLVKKIADDKTVSVVEYHISNLTSVSNGKETVLITDKIVIIDFKNKTAVYQESKQPLEENIAIALHQVVNYNSENNDKPQKNDDLVFGTNKKKKVGDNWEISKFDFVDGLNSDEMKFTEKDVTGFTTFEKAGKVDNEEVLSLSAKVDVSNIQFAGFGNGIDVVESQLTLNMKGDFPIDQTKKILNSETNMDIKIVAEGTLNQLKVLVKMDIKNKKTRHLVRLN